MASSLRASQTNKPLIGSQFPEESKVNVNEVELDEAPLLTMPIRDLNSIGMQLSGVESERPKESKMNSPMCAGRSDADSNDGRRKADVLSGEIDIELIQLV